MSNPMNLWRLGQTKRVTSETDWLNRNQIQETTTPNTSGRSSTWWRPSYRPSVNMQSIIDSLKAIYGSKDPVEKPTTTPTDGLLASPSKVATFTQNTLGKEPEPAKQSGDSFDRSEQFSSNWDEAKGRFKNR
jgi:hypothetical protein